MRDFDFEKISPYINLDGDNTAQTINSSDGLLFMLEIQNKNSAQAWVQLFDESSAINVGTTVSKLGFVIEKSDGTEWKSRIIYFGSYGLPFQNSIKYACTTTIDGSGDPANGLIINAIYANL